jgi:hypothetical protein
MMGCVMRGIVEAEVAGGVGDEGGDVAAEGEGAATTDEDDDDAPEPVCQSHFPAKQALATTISPKITPKPRATVTFAFIIDTPFTTTFCRPKLSMIIRSRTIGSQGANYRTN